MKAATRKEIILQVPELDVAIPHFLRARGCIVTPHQVRFPTGTTRTISQSGAVTAMTEWHVITLPDGLVLNEQFDKKRELSLLYVPLQAMTDGKAQQRYLEVLQEMANKHPVTGTLPDGRTVLLQQMAGTNRWKCVVSTSNTRVVAHTWEASNLDNLVVFGVSRYHVRLVDVPLETWSAT